MGGQDWPILNWHQHEGYVHAWYEHLVLNSSLKNGTCCQENVSLSCCQHARLHVGWLQSNLQTMLLHVKLYHTRIKSNVSMPKLITA